jgi:hypothetical protein
MRRHHDEIRLSLALEGQELFGCDPFQNMGFDPQTLAPQALAEFLHITRGGFDELLS